MLRLQTEKRWFRSKDYLQLAEERKLSIVHRAWLETDPNNSEALDGATRPLGDSNLGSRPTSQSQRSATSSGNAVNRLSYLNRAQTPQVCLCFKPPFLIEIYVRRKFKQKDCNFRKHGAIRNSTQKGSSCLPVLQLETELLLYIALTVYALTSFRTF